MKASVPFNLAIKPISSKSKSKQLTAGISNLLKASDLFYQEYAKRVLKASKSIVVHNDTKGSLRDSIRLIDRGGTLTLDTSSIGSGESQFRRNHLSAGFSEEESNEDEYNPYLHGQSEARASVQEFGYPFNRGIWSEYPPNPNSPKKSLAGFGYKRIAFIVAAASMATDYIDYTGSSFQVSNKITNYASTSEQLLYRSYQKIIDNYLAGKSVPKYLRKKLPTLPAAVPLQAGVSDFKLVVGYSLPINFETGYNPELRSPVGPILSNKRYYSVAGKPSDYSGQYLVDMGILIP